MTARRERGGWPQIAIVWLFVLALVTWHAPLLFGWRLSRVQGSPVQITRRCEKISRHAEPSEASAFVSSKTNQCRRLAALGMTGPMIFSHFPGAWTTSPFALALASNPAQGNLLAPRASVGCAHGGLPPATTESANRSGYTAIAAPAALSQALISRYSPASAVSGNFWLGNLLNAPSKVSRATSAGRWVRQAVRHVWADEFSPSGGSVRLDTSAGISSGTASGSATSSTSITSGLPNQLLRGAAVAQDAVMETNPAKDVLASGWAAIRGAAGKLLAYDSLTAGPLIPVLPRHSTAVAGRRKTGEAPVCKQQSPAPT